ncbi:hypothetical protein PM082_012404 [Marasmius tenuissimus]|nr:hypothetical protein PM082_012404 [Marasmius tenuissimus]
MYNRRFEPYTRNSRTLPSPGRFGPHYGASRTEDVFQFYLWRIRGMRRSLFTSSPPFHALGPRTPALLSGGLSGVPPVPMPDGVSNGLMGPGSSQPPTSGQAHQSVTSDEELEKTNQNETNSHITELEAVECGSTTPTSTAPNANPDLAIMLRGGANFWHDGNNGPGSALPPHGLTLPGSASGSLAVPMADDGSGSSPFTSDQGHQSVRHGVDENFKIMNQNEPDSRIIGLEAVGIPPITPTSLTPTDSSSPAAVMTLRDGTECNLGLELHPSVSECPCEFGACCEAQGSRTSEPETTEFLSKTGFDPEPAATVANHPTNTYSDQPNSFSSCEPSASSPVNQLPVVSQYHSNAVQFSGCESEVRGPSGSTEDPVLIQQPCSTYTWDVTSGSQKSALKDLQAQASLFPLIVLGSPLRSLQVGMESTVPSMEECMAFRPRRPIKHDSGYMLFKSVYYRKISSLLGDAVTWTGDAPAAKEVWDRLPEEIKDFYECRVQKLTTKSKLS